MTFSIYIFCYQLKLYKLLVMFKMHYPKYLRQVEEAISRFPGVGKTTAERMVRNMLTWKPEDISRLGDLVLHLKENIGFCTSCHYIVDSKLTLCNFCTDTSRDQTLLCVVEQYADIPSLELTGKYQGLYHVLGGALSPLKGMGPGQLTLDGLFARVKHGGFQEIIIATNPTMEGESTSAYIRRHLGNEHNITRIAKGMPMGGDIHYADEITLGNALDRREQI